MSKKTFTAEERRRAIEQFSPKIFYSDRYSGECSVEVNIVAHRAVDVVYPYLPWTGNRG